MLSDDCEGLIRKKCYLAVLGCFVFVTIWFTFVVLELLNK